MQLEVIFLAVKPSDKGRGSEHKPSLRTYDVSSLARVTRMRGWHTGRTQHTLSKLEMKVLLLLDWLVGLVVDVCDQCGLDVSKTREIANWLHVPHPYDKKKRDFKKMTTDFLITVLEGESTRQIAIAVKPSELLEHSSKQYVLEIERRYWQTQGIQFCIITEKELPESLIRNIAYCHQHTDPSKLTCDPQIIPLVKDCLVKETQRNPERSLADTAALIDEKLTLTVGTSLSIFRHLLATRQIEVDMLTEINVCEPVIIHQGTASGDRLVVGG